MRAVKNNDIVIRRAAGSDAAEVAEVWLRSFTAALAGVRRAYTDDEVRAWIREVVVPGQETWVAAADGSVVAMMVREGNDLDQLYVDPAWQGRGIGGRLVDVAKERTTCSGPAPTAFRAARALAATWSIWASRSPSPTSFPDASSGHCPAR
ncbi:Acetyltransferase (GNAT) domain-containing protein [Streptomyces sp. di188]|nr:Acetyltransferase (GNAT) domain-containing protein [Streptomyces sp. di50b]SCE38134.1 Acetyltransferase (GNAT) domain-containing protein [Streptomyces sp. di188]